MPTSRAGWQLIVPVKPAGLAKSRLGADARLARAIALDTIAAAARAARVARVLVVTADRELAALLDGAGEGRAVLEVVIEAEPQGIAAAIDAGLARSGAGEAGAPDSTGHATQTPRAVLLGDVPGLDPVALDAALELATSHPRAFVRDADGSGTTLVTAAVGVTLVARFGPDSAARHTDAGFVELPLPADSSLRRDVDTPAALAELLAGASPAPRTREALSQR